MGSEGATDNVTEFLPTREPEVNNDLAVKNELEQRRMSLLLHDDNETKPRRGRRKQLYRKRTFFLFRQSNPTYFPKKKERERLSSQGFGRKGPIDINRMWSMQDLERHILGLFNIPIVTVKLSFHKCDIKRKLVKLNVNTVDELEQTIPPGALILLVPDQDLPIIGVPNGLPNRNRLINYYSNQNKNNTQSEDEDEEKESFPLIIEDMPERGQVHIKTEVPDHENESLPDEHINDINYMNEPGCSTKKHDYQDEIFKLKLQLNSSQQARASLELQIRQKEEVILKTEAKLMKSNREIARLNNILNQVGQWCDNSST